MSYRSVFKPGLFEGQTVLVTGGGSGIGRCTAHEAAALGAHVVITGRKQEKLDTVRTEIEAAVCFLLSDASAYITGTEIRIDGGVPLANRSVDLQVSDRSKPFNGFHLAKTPKVLGGE